MCIKTRARMRDEVQMIMQCFSGTADFKFPFGSAGRFPTRVFFGTIVSPEKPNLVRKR